VDQVSAPDAPPRPARPPEQRDLHVWPRYEAAVLGFRDYWYPVTWSSRVGAKPVSFRLLGDPVMFRRERGKIHAFYDQCPHRGIPLSVGRQEFPGTWSCRYHGWTFDCQTGVLRAALTDGPDSPICGKVRVRTYPVEERAGLVWIWMGDGPPSVPVEHDIPAPMLAPNTLVIGRIVQRANNWRMAAENGYDEGHVVYLHRYGNLWTLFNRYPAWIRSRRGGEVEGEWLRRVANDVGPGGEYPGLGYWPRHRPWNFVRSPARTSVRLPGLLEVRMQDYDFYAWWMASTEDTHRYFQIMVKRGSVAQRRLFQFTYWLYRRWLHIQFTNQDSWMIGLMPMTAPERLYRPDASIVAWRRFCEHARGGGSPTGSVADTTAEEQPVASG
jgi:phenylpropionate dioxygenase-like ring-hydroxylating dioxygenase large terminal subunit